jgi:hypothetical protein
MEVGVSLSPRKRCSIYLSWKVIVAHFALSIGVNNFINSLRACFKNIFIPTVPTLHGDFYNKRRSKTVVAPINFFPPNASIQLQKQTTRRILV